MKIRYALLVVIACLTSAFFNQPLDERSAQDALPTSHHAMWAMLGKCKLEVDDKNYRFSIHFTDEVKKLSGQSITVSGFMLPLEPTEKFTHFLLSKRTPTCAFCPPGEPNEIIEVFSTSPVTWSDNLVTVTGQFILSNDGDKGLFFQMKQATL